MRPVRRQKFRDQIAKLHQVIAGLEAQQRELGLNFTQQIAELRRRLPETGSVSLRGSGALATTGGAESEGEELGDAGLPVSLQAT